MTLSLEEMVFDFVPGITVLQNNGKIIFTKVEPFGEFLFEKLRLSPNENYDGNEDIADDYNLNQKKYVTQVFINLQKLLHYKIQRRINFKLLVNTNLLVDPEFQ